MIKLFRDIGIVPVAALAGLALVAPAAAQDKAGDKVNFVTVYDENECPEQTAENETVICEILVDAERYRIPSNLRTSSSSENVSRVRQVESIRFIGEFGTQSCSPAGAGGITGCTEKFIANAFAEKEESEQVRFSQLIAEAREERLSTIDDDAAAEQRRVEQIEREYLERLERERAAPLPGEIEDASGPPPLIEGDEKGNGDTEPAGDPDATPL